LNKNFAVEYKFHSQLNHKIYLGQLHKRQHSLLTSVLLTISWPVIVVGYYSRSGDILTRDGYDWRTRLPSRKVSINRHVHYAWREF